MNEEAMIMKRDAGGRVVVPEERRVELVREYERSGLSGAKFAALAGVKYQTFVSWRRKHGSQRPARRRSLVDGAVGGRAWMEAVVEPDGCVGGGITLLLPGGARVEVRDEAQTVVAARLLKALACSESC